MQTKYNHQTVLCGGGGHVMCWKALRRRRLVSSVTTDHFIPSRKSSSGLDARILDTCVQWASEVDCCCPAGEASINAATASLLETQYITAAILLLLLLVVVAQKNGAMGHPI